MSNRHTLIVSVTLAIGLLSTTAAHAALESRMSGQAVYDTDLNITLLADANLAATNTFGVSGINSTFGTMNWTTTQSWITAMNTADYLGFNDWRLPTTQQPDATCSVQLSGGVSFGNGCSGSEMGHLFYNELGGIAGQSITTNHNASYSLFNNIQSQNLYWSGTEYAPSPGYAWVFFMHDGTQNFSIEEGGYNVWAVRSGDVAAVPEPEAWELMLSGLSLAAWAVRRRG